MSNLKQRKQPQGAKATKERTENYNQKKAQVRDPTSGPNIMRRALIRVVLIVSLMFLYNLYIKYVDKNGNLPDSFWEYFKFK